MTVLLMVATLTLFLVADYVIQKRGRHPATTWRPEIDSQFPWEVIPKNLQLAPNHLWLRRESDGSTTIGIDRFISGLLGAPDAITLPVAGALASPDVRSIALQQGGKALTIAVPMNARVLETNALISGNPRLVNVDPYGAGWLMRIQPTTPDGTSDGSLMSPQSAKEWLHRQIALVKDFLGMQLHSTQLALVQDGGVPVYGILRQCSGQTWDEFQELFVTLKESTQGEHSNA
jgi:glycine cleavage system H protein